jgi:hypothetical protein
MTGFEDQLRLHAEVARAPEHEIGETPRREGADLSL